MPTDTMNDSPTSGLPEYLRNYDARRFLPDDHPMKHDVSRPAISHASDLIGLQLQDGQLRMCVITRGAPPFDGMYALPGGFIDRGKDGWMEDVTEAALRETAEESGLEATPGLVEPLDVVDSAGRDPREFGGRFTEDGEWEYRGAQVISHPVVALYRRSVETDTITGQDDASHAEWRCPYEFMPWEDRTEGAELYEEIRERLEAWSDLLGGPEGETRRATVQRVFSPEADAYAADRYDLMLQAGLVHEAWRDRYGQKLPVPEGHTLYGKEMAFDHRMIASRAIGRVRTLVRESRETLDKLLPQFADRAERVRAEESVMGRRGALARPHQR